MMILRGPAASTGGAPTTSSSRTSTCSRPICEVAGIDPPPWLQGRSLPAGRRRRAPSCAGDLLRAHLSRRLRAAAGDSHRALQVHPPLRRLPVLRCCRTATTARAKTPTWPADGRDRPVSREALHDLFFNPGEGRNVIDDPITPRSPRDLRAASTEWMVQTADPLLDGPVPHRRARRSTLRISARRDEPTFVGGEAVGAATGRLTGAPLSPATSSAAGAGSAGRRRPAAW